MLKKIVSGIAAGILISIGGTTFLKCDNRYIGAVLFTVALLCICYQGYSLYTGKICYVPTKTNKEYLSIVFLGLFGNLIGTLLCGVVLRFTDSGIYDVALKLCDSKLSQTWYQTIIKGIFCGILIYLAVDIFAKKKTPVGIIFCIPVFILCGFEHSVADMFYFASGAELTLNSIVYILLVILGNTIGGILLPIIEVYINGKEKSNEKV